MTTQISSGRVVELINPTEEQRKAIGRAVAAIRKARNISFEKIYGQSHGSMAGFGLEDEKNLNKGIIAQTKATAIFRWIVENHLPLACSVAPKVFDPSLLTRWRDFLARCGVYDRLQVKLMGERGLTERSSGQPIAADPIKLGQEFLFSLASDSGGALLALEMNDGKTYPIAMHHDHATLTVEISSGDHILPQRIDGAPDPISEVKDAGLRGYVFILAHADIISECTEGMVAAHPINADKLDQIAFAFEGIDASLFEVHRLNVIFSG